MPLPPSLLLASDATWAATAGGGFMLIALLALLAERRRARRSHIDAVGWMPWTTLFFLAFFCGVLLLSVALKAWRAG